MMNDDNAPRAPQAELGTTFWREVRDLIQRLEGSTVRRLAVQLGEYRVEIERAEPTVVAGPGGLTVISAGPEGADAARAAPPDNRHPVVAPLVGTFYRSPQPGAKAFVEEGDQVEKGQTVAIVEAMKIMNQISAERSGRVAEIVVKDGEWVEFQQVLMYLEPTEA